MERNTLHEIIPGIIFEILLLCIFQIWGRIEANTKKVFYIFRNIFKILSGESFKPILYFLSNEYYFVFFSDWRN